MRINLICMEKMFNSIDQVSGLDKIFTFILKKISKSMKSEFASYTGEFGISTNALDEFILYSIDDIMVENENGDIEIYYKFSDNNIAKLIGFFVEYDFVTVNPNKMKCIVSKSNYPELAKTLNKLFTI